MSIVVFPNGSAVDSEVIAGIHVEPSRTGQYGAKARIVVHVHKSDRDPLLGLMRGASKGVEHFMSIDMESDAAACEECRKLVNAWAGLPLQVKEPV